MYKIHTLPCGIRCICEKIPYVHSVSLGVRVLAGTRNEEEKFWGISHFIEHMLFKGTKTRCAREIAEFVDSFGGHLNAFTARDNTCYYIKAMDGHLEKCFEILSDMILQSKFDKEDIKRERNVILEEISMYEDSPEELLFDTLDEICYYNQPIGRNILGSKKSLEGIDKKKIQEYMSMRYTAENIVISAAGNLDEEVFFSLAEKYFGKVQKGEKNLPDVPPEYTLSSKTVVKNIEQAHIGLAFPGMSEMHEDTYAMSIANNILGGGMSSRLYQRIREELGLAYSVDSSLTYYKDSGIISIYAAVSPENEEKAKEEIIKEIEKIKLGIKEEEFERAKEQVKSACVLSSEGTSGRMSTMGKQLLMHGYIQTDEEFIEKINALQKKDVDKVLNKYFDFSKMNVAVVRP